MGTTPVSIKVTLNDKKIACKYTLEVSGIGYNSVFATSKLDLLGDGTKPHRELARCLKQVSLDKNVIRNLLSEFQLALDNALSPSNNVVTATYLQNKNRVVVA